MVGYVTSYLPNHSRNRLTFIIIYLFDDEIFGRILNGLPAEMHNNKVIVELLDTIFSFLVLKFSLEAT